MSTDTQTGAIERLAHLSPSHRQVEEHALAMFFVLRGFVVLDWILKHPHDMSQEKAAAKFAGLVEKAAEIAGKIQQEAEEGDGK